MPRGKLVLLIPSQARGAGVRKLTQDMTRASITVLDKTDALVLARWDDATRNLVAAGAGIESFHTDKIGKADIDRLPESAARVATLWNWSIDKRGRAASEKDVKKIMASLQLEVKDGRVQDVLLKKSIGNVTSKEDESNEGNWYLYQNRGYTNIPGWFGFWQKLWCKSRTFPTSSTTGNRLVVDYISAEVDGPQHYATEYKREASIAYAEAWDYVWVGESCYGDATSYARKGSTTLTITRAI